MLVKLLSWLAFKFIGKGKVDAAYVTYSFESRGLNIATLALIAITAFLALILMSDSSIKEISEDRTWETRQKFEVTKCRQWLIKGNSGLPKGRNPHGNGSAILGLYRRLHTEVRKFKNSPKLGAHDDTKSLREMLVYDIQGRCINAFQVLSDISVLKSAYDVIKSKPGNMTPGVDRETLDGIPVQQWLEKTRTLLGTEKYKCKPVIRVRIPKPNSTKTRPLGIASPRDKIVQEAMRAILEAILEPKFSDYSHGFRPGRGCHTALARVRYWRGVKWFIEGWLRPIKGFFDNIDHHVLEALLKRHINDMRFLNLYWKMARAGYVEFGKEINTNLGVASPTQGSIVSPILSNLVLHELDSYVAELQTEQEKNNKGQKPTVRNPVYDKIMDRIQAIMRTERRRKEKGQELDELRREERRALIQLRSTLPSSIPNGKVASFQYVRYADDLLIGLTGSRAYAETLKAKIKHFLTTIKLELSDEKTLITNAGTDKAQFLGTEIQRISDSRGQVKHIPAPPSPPSVIRNICK